ncbi:MAG: hypothetical protein J6X56_01875 [Ruminococcus sp.]|nr:hypothetical protein [Ruminococcus sp.]
MTIKKRTRILEIIAALLMIRPTFSTLSILFSYHDIEAISNNLKYYFPSLFATIALVIVIITRKYDRIWSKLLVLTSLAAYFYSDKNINYLKGFGDSVRAFSHDTVLLLEYLFHVLLFIVGITAGIILVLTMFGKIKWKKRTSLIIYTYIMIGIMTLGALNYGFSNVYYIELVLMPCLIYELQEKRDIKAIAGWAGVLVTALSDTVFDYLTEKAKNDLDEGFLDYLNYSTKYERLRSLVFIVGIILIPLIMFERKEKLERIVIPVDDDDEEENEVKDIENDNDND